MAVPRVLSVLVTNGKIKVKEISTSTRPAIGCHGEMITSVAKISYKCTAGTAHQNTEVKSSRNKCEGANLQFTERLPMQ